MDCLINSPSSTTPSQLCLLDLNDYCLLEIMSHFNVNDLILASTLCKRLQYNAHRLFPDRLKLWKDISGNDESSCRFLLSKIGPHLTDIEVHDGGDGIPSIDDTMAMVKENCVNLEAILLHHSVPKDLSALPQNLKKISIKFPQNWSMTTEFVESLKLFNCLESLSLNFEQSTTFNSRFLTELPPLQLLRLKNCSVDPMDLKICLDNSKSQLKFLTLTKCFAETPNALSDTIDQLIELQELELQFQCQRDFFIPSSIFRKLNLLAFVDPITSIDVDKLLNGLFDYNKVHTLSLRTIDNSRPLRSSTLKRLHCLTSLRRLELCETDFVTDEFLLAITMGKSLTHFTYKQTYRPMLSLEAFLAFVSRNGINLKKCSYTIYHDVGDLNPTSEQKNELLNAYRKTGPFQRIRQCNANISNRLTFVEFLFE